MVIFHVIKEKIVKYTRRCYVNTAELNVKLTEFIFFYPSPIHFLGVGGTELDNFWGDILSYH